MKSSRIVANNLLPWLGWFALGAWSAAGAIHAQDTWPPQLRGADNGTAVVHSKQFLDVPPRPMESKNKGSLSEPRSAYDVAKAPPKVELAYHNQLGRDPQSRRLWSSWGDICVAENGDVYCAIGDHGDAVNGDARAFLYRWRPQLHQLVQVVDFNQVAPRKEGQPAWSKVHAKIDQGPDGMIYVSCTLNDGNRAKRDDYRWSDVFSGGQIYRYDPTTADSNNARGDGENEPSRPRATVFASLPAKRCTATSLLDVERGIWWCNLEAGEGDALWGLDLKTRKVVYQTEDGVVAFNRSIALLNDGKILFNGEMGLSQLDPSTGEITAKASIPDSPGMRCATRVSQQGFIYGATYKTNQLFRYDTKRDRVQLLGSAWADRGYTTVMVLSPDERFLYYLPGAHGQAWLFGTPVIQYNLVTGRRKVLAFLAPTLEKECGYVPGGTYGVKLSADGGVLYVNFNGHAADGLRTPKMKPNGFGLCAFAAIHIPPEERK